MLNFLNHFEESCTTLHMWQLGAHAHIFSADLTYVNLC